MKILPPPSLYTNGQGSHAAVMKVKGMLVGKYSKGHLI